MINKDLRSTKQQLENTDTVTTNRKELQQLAQLHILGWKDIWIYSGVA